MIDRDAAWDFNIPMLEGANFVEVSMPRGLMQFQKWFQLTHPNTSNLSLWEVVEWGTLVDLNTNLRGGVVLVKEDPLNSIILDEGKPLKVILEGRLIKNRVSGMHSPSLQ
ncbi:hypothetical protein SynBIOSE41_03844 [Synechococcus sp. BIOS-E4-1]|uniref:hypothetical protein n=1 Tax=Synechococcus sp. BIOS-E4-1 TaxID=1400864 RepID=UPI00164722D1|nr:hypothetical protein [Synechococcus sp. BIOS-E4-1]QNI56312.1 hypothetical protein SynBIOSE41_03844 [Synechococcus sp. BIOS-E4-1]